MLAASRVRLCEGQASACFWRWRDLKERFCNGLGRVWKNLNEILKTHSDLQMGFVSHWRVSTPIGLSIQITTLTLIVSMILLIIQLLLDHGRENASTRIGKMRKKWRNGGRNFL